MPPSETPQLARGGPVSHALEHRRRLGSTDLDISPVVLGTMQFGWTVTDVEAMRLLDAYLWAGGNAIDTANMYGGDQTVQMFAANEAHVGVSEDIIGRWLHTRRCRDTTVVTTKVRARMWWGPDGEGLNRGHIVRAVEDSLRRLRTDHVDVLYAHWPDPLADPEEWLIAIGDLIRSGKVRYAGSSNFYGFDDYGDQLTPLLEHAARNSAAARIRVEQPRYNLLNREEYEGGLQELAVRAGLGIVCYSALAGGFLAGRFRDTQAADGPRASYAQQYFTPAGWELLACLEELAGRHQAPVAAVSLAWTLAQSGVTGVIVGPDSTTELAEASHAPEVHLTEEEIAMLDQRSVAASQPEFVTW